MSQGRHGPIYLSFDLKGQCHEICYSIFWVSYIKAENTDIKESVTPRNFADIQIYFFSYPKYCFDCGSQKFCLESKTVFISRSSILAEITFPCWAVDSRKGTVSRDFTFVFSESNPSRLLIPVLNIF